MFAVCTFIARALFLYSLVLAGNAQSQTLRPAEKSECLAASRSVYPVEAVRQKQQGRVELVVQLERLAPGEEAAKITKVEPSTPETHPLLTQAAVAAASKFGGCRIPLSDADRASFKTAVVFKLDATSENVECSLSELNALSLPVVAPGPLSWISISYKIVSKPDSPDVSMPSDIKVLGLGGDDPRMKEYLKQLGQLQLPSACAVDGREKGRYVSFAKRSASGFGGYSAGSYGLYAFNQDSQKALREIPGLPSDGCPVKASLMIRPNAFNEILDATTEQDPRLAAWFKSAKLNPALSFISGKLQIDIACRIDKGYLQPIL